MFMTELEVKDFLQKVKAHYQEFKIDEVWIVKEWIDNLVPFDKEDIYAKWQEHLDNENVAKEIPKIHFLTKWLTPSNEKKKKKVPIKGIFPCKWCGIKCSNTYILALHQERCLRIRYIARICDKLKIDPTPYFGVKWTSRTLDELNKGYNNFILKIIDEEKKQHKLSQYEKLGIRTYYNNVIKKERK